MAPTAKAAETYPPSEVQNGLQRRSPRRRVAKTAPVPSQEIESKQEIVSCVPRPVVESVPGSRLDGALGLMERIASNPNVDASKLREFWALQEAVMDREAREQFELHLIEMKADLPIIKKNTAIKAKGVSKITGEKWEQSSPYASWDAVREIIDPILFKHGFVLTHRIEEGPEYTDSGGTQSRMIRVRAILRGYGHRDESTYIDFFQDNTGSKNSAQGRGSAILYGERYTSFAVLGLVARGEDNDGRNAGTAKVVGEPISPMQLDELILFACSVKCAKPKLIKHLNNQRPPGHPEMTELENLPATRFNEALEALKSYDANRRHRDAMAANNG